ncbi:hypothetical protein [Azospirillum doebereinerae]|uniref:PH domain-containing protein n=1 Tax=Azospirillum doebereinerae TaxID=92933 RepID=A0A3S1CGM9_9PROT|nr:hypothetical protein [Azospirillum doebereinerae]RUQ70145.1 hypothetical protein EJ913_14170 [Azospirillum doebereinerae]
MKGFSIAANDWGVHAILYKGFTEADSAAWLAALREAVGMVGKAGRASSLFADLRDATLSSASLDGLFAQLTRMGIGRSAVLLSDPATAKRLRAALDTANAGHAVRVLVTDGRDRVSIAAAYSWILNGTEPRAGRVPDALSGEILTFPAPVRDSFATQPPMRAAS